MTALVIPFVRAPTSRMPVLSWWEMVSRRHRSMHRQWRGRADRLLHLRQFGGEG